MPSEPNSSTCESQTTTVPVRRDDVARRARAADPAVAPRHVPRVVLPYVDPATEAPALTVEERVVRVELHLVGRHQPHRLGAQDLPPLEQHRPERTPVVGGGDQPTGARLERRGVVHCPSGGSTSSNPASPRLGSSYVSRSTVARLQNPVSCHPERARAPSRPGAHRGRAFRGPRQQHAEDVGPDVVESSASPGWCASGMPAEERHPLVGGRHEPAAAAAPGQRSWQRRAREAGAKSDGEPVARAEGQQVAHGDRPVGGHDVVERRARRRAAPSGRPAPAATCPPASSSRSAPSLDQHHRRRGQIGLVIDAIRKIELRVIGRPAETPLTDASRPRSLHRASPAPPPRGPGRRRTARRGSAGESPWTTSGAVPAPRGPGWCGRSSRCGTPRCSSRRGTGRGCGRCGCSGSRR